MRAEALYNELAPYYDCIYARKSYEREVREIARRIAREGPPGARTLLDVGCGTGRHLELFRRRFEVTGVDASPAMLRVARGRLGRNVPLHRGDMRSFRLGRTYDVVVCLFSAIGYLLTRADRDRALRTLFAHLRPGGLLLVEGWIRPDRFRGGAPHLLTYDGDDAKVARMSRTTRRGDRTYLAMDYLLAVPGRPVRHYRELHVNALVEPEELLGSFRRAGFRARVITSGRYADRGLYVGRRPRRAPHAPRARGVRAAREPTAPSRPEGGGGAGARRRRRRSRPRRPR